MKKSLILFISLFLIMGCENKNKDNVDEKLFINPQPEVDIFGHITFSKDDKTLIYFVEKTRKGKIVINGKEYFLNSCSFAENTYNLSGKEVTIIAQNLIDQGSGDCFHFICPEVIIMLNGVSTSIKDVIIQDCLSFSWD